MTPPDGFEEHPVISLDWTVELLDQIDNERRVRLVWNVPIYEFVAEAPVEVSLELRKYVLADKIAAVYDFHHGFELISSGETAEFRVKAGKALQHCRGLLDAMTTYNKNRARILDDQFTSVLVEAFSSTAPNSQNQFAAGLLGELARLTAALERKMNAFDAWGPGGGRLHRSKQSSRQLVRDLFFDCWIVRNLDGSPSSAKTPHVFLRFLESVLKKMTDPALNLETIARAYRSGSTDRAVIGQKHGKDSVEQLRVLAKARAEKHFKL